MESRGKLQPKKNTKLDFTGTVSKTKQAFKHGTQVDNILKRYATMGVDANDVGLFQRHVAQSNYGIADTTLDYQAQLNRVIKVQEYFRRLPSSTREKFRNDPANMIAFIADPKNKTEAIKLGLVADPTTNKDEKKDDKKPEPAKTPEPEKKG